MLIRPATDRDLDEILAIHNTAVRESLAIWTETEETRDDRAAWLAAHEEAGEPVLIADVDGRVAGYATYGRFRPKMGYRYSVENSVYVHGDFQRQGIGRLLMVQLIAEARAAGIHVMIAGIEAGNAASIALHRQLGFEEPLILREAGTKFGRWLDLAFMRLPLD